MQIGVSSYSFQKYRRESGCSYSDLCRLSKEIGFDAIEFIGLEGDAFGEATRIRETCEAIGLEISAYTIGADFLSGDPADTVSSLCTAIDVAECLGARLLRHDVGYVLPEGMRWWEAIERIADPIRKVTEYAAEKKIRTCTENHGFVFQDSERMMALMETVRHPNYGWLVDMGNFLCADEQPTMAVRVAAPYAFHVHAKDFLRQEPSQIRPEGFFESRGGVLLRGTVLGHGVVDILTCTRILRESGYDGVLSLEFEGMEENLPAVRAGYHYLQAVRQACAPSVVGK